MEPVRDSQSGKVGRLTIIVIGLVSILLNVILVVSFCGRTSSTSVSPAAGAAVPGQAGRASGRAAPGTTRGREGGAAAPSDRGGAAEPAAPEQGGDATSEPPLPDWRKEAQSWAARREPVRTGEAPRGSDNSSGGSGGPGSGGRSQAESHANASSDKSGAASRSNAPVVPVVTGVAAPYSAAPLAARNVPTQAAVSGDTTVAVPDDPTSDRRPPVLQGLNFDPPEINDGGVTTLIVNATDDLSGVQRVSGTLSSPSGAAIIPFRAEGDPSGSVFSVRLSIPAKAETGVWFVSSLYILDKADNPLALSFGATSVPPGGALRVSSAESDSTPPTVHDARMDKATVAGGERNHIRIEIDDDRSGVASVTGAFQSPTKSATIPFICRASADAGYWEGDISVPRDADCGAWSLQHLRVADTANNIAFLWGDNPVVARVTFGVSGDSCDSTPPTLDAFSLAPTTVSSEQQTEVVITAVISDVGSGALSMTGVVSGPPASSGQVPTIFFSGTRVTSDSTGQWTGKIIVPRFAAKGLWRVTLVRLQDKAMNIREYKAGDPALSQGMFQVQ